MKMFRFLEGFLIGGLIGAALALLMSPESGEDFRNKIMAETERIKGEVSSAANERRSDLEKQLASLRAPRSSGPGAD